MAVAALFVLAALALGAHAASIQDCKTTFQTTIRVVGKDHPSRCTALVTLATCFNGVTGGLTSQQAWEAQGYLDSLQFMEKCTSYTVPTFVPSIVTTGNNLQILHTQGADVIAARGRAAQSTSVWNVVDNLATVQATLSASCKTPDLLKAQTSFSTRVSTALSTISKALSSQVSIMRTQLSNTVRTKGTSYRQSSDLLMHPTTSRINETLSTSNSMYTYVSTTLPNNMAAVRASTMAWLSSLQSTVNSNTSSVVAKYSSMMTSTAANYVDDISTLRSQISSLTVASTNITTNTSKLMSTITPYVSKIATYTSTFMLTPYLNRQLPVYRYMVFSTYSQNYGYWYAQNNAVMFGGVNPSLWGDSGAYAYQISPVKDQQRALFTRKGFMGWSGTVWAEEWYYYSSTNSKQIATLFRIKNTLSTPVSWTAYWYFSAYGGWGEYASVTMNGLNIYSYTSDCSMCSTSVGFTLPASRTSTIIFISASSYPSTTRCVYQAFYQDCLRLPTGLEYADDLDTITGGWET